MILEILSWRAGKEITGLMFGCSVCSLVYYYVEMLFCPIPIKIVSLMHALSIGMINEYLCIDNNKNILKYFEITILLCKFYYFEIGIAK